MSTFRRWAGLCLALLAFPLSAQTVSPGRILERIEFEGNTAFADEELRALLQSRAAERSPLHRVLAFYVHQLQRNPATPSVLLQRLQQLLAQLESGLPVLDPRLAEADAETLYRFYVQQGFHHARITPRIDATPDGGRILRFHIQEGPAARIDTLLYLGLDSLPAPLQGELRRYRRLRPGMRFRERALLEELEAIRRFLHEHGYPYARYEPPQIYILADRNSDSILVRFFPGPRLRFGKMHLWESSRREIPLTERIRQFCTEFRPGQWYDVRAVERTRLRLLRLGVFEVVRLDSLHADLDSGTVDVLFVSRYRRPQEALLSTAIYRTLLESAPNVGLEFQLSTANLFGGAERGSFLGQISLRDPLGALERGQLEYEFQLSAGLSLPYLTRQVGLSSRLGYGIRVLASPLQLEALGLQARLPVEFAPWTWVTTSELMLDVRAERPRNYLEAVASVDTSASLRSFLRQYERLYQYTHNGQRLFPPSDVTISLTLGADHRDHPATPRSGHALLSSFELGGLGTIGLAQYVRLQLLLLGFSPLTSRTVLAGKFRLGSIWWRNRGYSYVPYDRHFFAGGANSVRGWASRSLWDPLSGGIVSGAASRLASYIGGGLLLEGSCELRWRFPPVRVGALSPYVEKLVLVGFLDWGNVYNRLTPELYGTATWGTVVRNLALSTGIGIGYLTDVGPVRLDAALRIHDPMNPSARWIFQRPGTLRQLMLHLGLGYAF